MPSTSIPPCTQRICEHCSAPIPVGPFKPRRFCSDRCRKAAARWSIRTQIGEKLLQVGSDLKATKIAPTVESAKTGVEKPNEINVRVNGQSEGPINLVGGNFRPRAGSLDQDLVAKIFAAELGIPTTTVVSLDGVISTVTHTHWISATHRPVARVSPPPRPAASSVSVG
jgi:hypothetical protein